MISTLKLLFSTRIWVLLSVLLSLGVFFYPPARVITTGNETLILLIEVVILVLATGLTIFTTYEVEGVKSFFNDIVADVMMLVIAACSMTYILATGLTGYWLPVATLGVAIVFAFFDFVFSLNGGASKLLEMDKGRVSVDRSWSRLPARSKKIPLAIAGGISHFF
jgi:hypothetical protein